MGMEQKKVKVSEYLKCLFTREEKEVFSDELARKIGELREKEGRKKEIMKSLDSEAAAMERQISELARKVKDGYEHRDVLCERTYDYAEGKKYTTRMDTGEIFKEVMLTAEELQIPMQLEE